MQTKGRETLTVTQSYWIWIYSLANLMTVISSTEMRKLYNQ